ncbi:MAG: 50S ribosomal protein L25 [Candidatus Komeilibacteria bacterium]
MQYTLKAEKREIGTPSALNELRAAKKIPGIIYGHGTEPLTIAVDYLAFSRLVTQAGESSLVTMEIPGVEPFSVLIKDVQYDPVKDRVIHFDLHRIRMDEEVKAEVKLVFVGESPAVKEMGANLVTNMDHVRVECLPKDLPHELSVDLSGLKEIGDAISIADLKIPTGVKVVDEAELTIVSVMHVKEEKVPEGPVETVVAEAVKQGAEAEPAVEGDKKEGKREEKKEGKKE